MSRRVSSLEEGELLDYILGCSPSLGTLELDFEA